MPGNALKIWSLDASGAPTLADSIIVSGISTVSDVEVSADGAVLMFSAEGVEKAGLYLYSLDDPADPGVPRQRIGRAGPAHRDVRGDRGRPLRLHRARTRPIPRS